MGAARVSQGLARTTPSRASASGLDVICYDEPVSGNVPTYAGPAGFVDMEIVGNATSTLVYCLNFTTPDGGCAVFRTP